jgi:hypothetical protein
MADGQLPPTIDELLDAFITAWHAGEVPSVDAFVARVGDDAEEQRELDVLIAAFLELAPTVQPTTARSTVLAADPLVERIAQLEADRWDAAGGADAVEASGSAEGTAPAPIEQAGADPEGPPSGR